MNLLALEGGGVRGYGQVLILDDLELEGSGTLASRFQMIAGTSVGAIVGAPLAIGRSSSQIKEFFTKDAPLIFKSDFLESVEELLGPKYSAGALEAALMSLLGTAKLKDCQTKFLATAFDCTSGRPVYFKSYEPSSETEKAIVVGNDTDIELWQVARASSAAQTYFPAYELGAMVLIDGGNVGLSAPDLLAYGQAQKFVAPYQIKMLSLGTGESPWQMNAAQMIAPKPWEAAMATLDILFAAPAKAIISQVSEALGDRYIRLSPQMASAIKLDDVKTALAQFPLAVTDLLAKDGDLLKQF